ncbi:MAG: cytochrome c [Bdellovibrionales bacterium]
MILKYMTCLMLMAVSRCVFASTPPPIAQTCVACHGPAGISNNPLWPNLAGQKRDYLVKQISDFKADRRKDPLMSPMAKTLSDQDVTVLADYFSGLTGK